MKGQTTHFPPPDSLTGSGGGRNYGIDLLRIVSMFYIVILHALGAGCVLETAEIGSAHYKAAWFLEIWAYCAVDVFGIISGYVGFSPEKKKRSYAPLALLWLQVVFYNAAVAGFYALVQHREIQGAEVLRLLFPVTNNIYWYFTAYFALYFLTPLLGAAVRGLDGRQLKVLLAQIFVIFAVYDNVVHRMGMGAGYSLLWLIVLYLIGAILRKCGIGRGLSPLGALAGIAALIAVSWLAMLYGPTWEVGGYTLTGQILVSYTSPTIAGAAVLYVLGAEKLRIPAPLRRLIAFLAPGSFAVYILNCHPMFWQYTLIGKFAYLNGGSVPALAATVLGFSVCFTGAALLLDRVRALLFRALGIDRAVRALDARICGKNR